MAIAPSLGFAAITFAPVAGAAEETDWNSVVAAHYIAEAVYDHCGFQPTSGEVVHLDGLLKQAERESGLTDEELQALRDDIAENAGGNPTEFCATNGRYVRSTAIRR